MTLPRRVFASSGRDSHVALLYALLISPDGAGDGVDAVAAFVAELPLPSESELWLILAVLRGQLPLPSEVVSARRSIDLDGMDAVFRGLVKRSSGAALRVLHGGVVVDAHHTVNTSLSTGIQRVVRNVLDEWYASHECTLVAWNRGFRHLHVAPPGSHRIAGAELAVDNTPVVPWRCVYLLPELAVEEPRLSRFEAIAEYSAEASGAIGFDCVPMTSAETCGPGMPGAFAKNLAAMAHVDKIAAISDAAAQEYNGWRAMLPSAGLTGPVVKSIGLPLEAIPEGDKPVDPRAALRLGAAPIVLCLGSHEPRKNHLAVLHAAELLWREGHDFQLVFVGGNGWGSESYARRIDELRAQGRPVSSHSRVPDSTVSALMRTAEFTVFPSLSEGYGLPVAESIASGTPVVTSKYGSMAAIAEVGGAVLVDPRNDDDLARGMRSLLGDSALRERLAKEAGQAATTNWAAYSNELWSFFVE